MEKHSYEIEIKSLLGALPAANAFVEKLKAQDPALRVTERSQQLNHYFEGGSLESLISHVAPLLEKAEVERLKDVASRASAVSVRTRQADEKILFVVKASIDDTTSENGTARLEFEAPVSVSLDELDQCILKAGFSYQAKWSRERTGYAFHDTTVTLDKNAGYGYVAEFEKVIDDPVAADEAKRELRSVMAELGVSDLPQDRLARMFAHYNAHWPEYYGTENVFTIE